MRCPHCKRSIEQIRREDGLVQVSSDEEFICRRCKNKLEYEAMENFHRKRFGVYELNTEIENLKTRIDCLKNGIIDDETLSELVKEHNLYKELKFQVIARRKEAFRLKDENRYLKTILNSKYGKYGDVRLDILHRLREKCKNIFDECKIRDDELENSSVNHKYYDQILDEIDKEIYQITGGES